MRRKTEDSSSEYNWMDTYGDMVTLLLTFFVLLYSMSTVDQAKWEKIVNALSSKTGTKPQQIVVNQTNGAPSSKQGLVDSKDNGETITEVKSFDDLYKYLKQYVKEKNIEADVSVFKGDGYTFLSFKNNVFFDGNSSALRPEGKVILDYLSDATKNISKEIAEVRTFGHTARASTSPNAPIEDRTLSAMRANNVVLYLQMKNIIDPRKMVAEGYGEYRPIVPHDGSEATRVKNRRVEIYISKSDKANTALDDIYKEISKSNQ
jgi:chemotaxis protein MotB